MKKKFLTVGGAVLALALSTTALFGCNNEPAFDADELMKGFTSVPTSGSITYKATFKLDVNSDNPAFLSFAKDVDDTIVIDYDLSAGNIYYYAKKTTKNGDVSEQLLTKVDGTYKFVTTSAPAVILADDNAAIAALKENMATISKSTVGYVDVDAFLYTGQDWAQKYVLLGSENIEAKGSAFQYTYSKADEGLKLDLAASYIGYYGDMGVFEFGTDATHTGSTVSLTTTKEGYITSLNQTFSNHLDMPIVNPPIPLDLSGSRSMTATYGSVEKKSEIAQDQIRVQKDANVKSYTTHDFNLATFSGLNTPSDTITVGNYLAIKVEVAGGYEVDQIIVNGVPATNMNGIFCYMAAAKEGDSYDVQITTKEAVEIALATVELSPVEHATVTIHDFNMQSVSDPTEKVIVGDFIAVLVQPDEGYELESVMIDGQDITTATYGSPYCCFKASEVKTYTVIVTVKAK